MKTITGILFFVCITLMSCDPNGFSIWGNLGNDDPEPITTCEEYQELTNLKWCAFIIQMEGTTSSYHFFYKPGAVVPIEINIDSMLSQYGTPSIFYDGVDVFGMLDGIDAPTYTMQHYLYLTDTIGGFNLLYFNPYIFVTDGTMEFEAFFDLLQTHANFKRLGFWNCPYTCDQLNMIFDWIRFNCIDGTGDKMDLRHLPAECYPIDPIILQDFDAADFTVLLP